MATKILSGRELAGFIKERQAHQVAALPSRPSLLIIRDSNNPVIDKYVNLKIRYGEDIGVKVEDFQASSHSTASTSDSNLITNSSANLLDSASIISDQISAANADSSTHGIIIQLPLTDLSSTDTLCDQIAPEKDVDGLGTHALYDSATATAILWLLAGYDINLKTAKIAIVGRGKLVGAPLYRMFQASGYDVSLFHRGSDLTKLKNFDIIISATGVPGLISDSIISSGSVLVDAGTASEKGIIKGDLAPELYDRTDLAAITPVLGGVGPLTVACLFDHVIQAASAKNS